MGDTLKGIVSSMKEGNRVVAEATRVERDAEKII